MILLIGIYVKSINFLSEFSFLDWARHGTHFFGFQDAVYTKYAHYGGPRTPWKSSWRVLEHQNYEKIEVSAAYDDLLGVSLPLHLHKIDPKLVEASSTTASCSNFDAKMLRN